MPTCSDRQLVQSQIEAGFSNSRVGVARAVRPFSGQASPEALVDYINRELFPAVKAGREKLNEVYLQVADNAPSANPLAYYFSTSTVNADPTPGRTRLNSATQSAATVIRVSELNAQLQSAVTWLDVMAGSSTTPIGVVTINDRINPGRFVRFNLDTMTDQGTYWDLGVTPIESSHDNPFVEGQPVVVSFIASVASGGVVPGPPAVTNRQIGLVSHVGGQAVSSVSRLAFSNASNVTFSLSTAANAATLFASVAAGVAGGIAASANGSSQSAGTVVWSNSNNVSFGMNGSTITASVTVASTQGSVRISAGTTNALASQFSFANGNNVSFSMNGSTISGSVGGIQSIAGGTRTGIGPIMVFSDSNNVSFGINLVGNSIMTATASDVRLGTISHVGGNSLTGIVQLAFQNSNNVSFTLSTAAAAATLVASVTVASTADPQIGLVSHIGGNSVSSVTRLAFSNASNVTWSVSTAANAATVIASVAAGGGGADGGVFASAAGSSQTAGQVVWSNSNNVSFGMNGSTITATASVASSLTAIRISAGTTSNLLSAITFADGGNVSFGINASTLTANVASSLTNIRVSAGTTSNLLSAITFSNANSVSFGFNGASVITASLGPFISTFTNNQIGVVSHVGGNSVASVTLLAFSNASNVTFSLSTAAGAATVLASVGAGGGGGIQALFAGGGNITSGSVTFGPGVDTTLALTGNVSFDVNGQQINAAAAIVFSNPGGAASRASRLDFVNSNNLTWGLASTSNASGRVVQVTASVTGMANFSWWRNFHRDGDVAQTITRGGASFFHVFPIHNYGPFQGNMTMRTLEFMVMGHSHTSTQSTGSWAYTIRGGLYTLGNSTQITLINSFSTTFSSTTLQSNSINDRFANARWLSVHSSLWSSAPVLSAGVNYWIGMNVSTAGVNNLSGIVGQQANQANARGFVNVANANLNVTALAPFWGWVSNSVPAVSIAHNAGVFQTGTAASEIQFAEVLPAIQIRDGITN